MGSKGKKKHKEKSSKKDSKKEHHDKKHKKERKEKSSKRSRRRDSSPSSTSSSGSDAALDVNTQLAKSRAAARATREILAYKYELRSELRELVRQLDGGTALDVSGIPDEFLRARLLTLFDNLLQLKKNSAGQYFKRREAAPVLSFIAPLLEEAPASLAAYAKPASQAAAPAAGGPAQQDGAAECGAMGGGAGPGQQEQQQQQQPQQEQQEEDSGGPTGPIGPQAGPPHEFQEGLVGSEDEGSVEDSEAGPGEAGKDAAAAVAAVRRALGPSMPTREQLEAAAQMEYLLHEEGGKEEEEELLVGPPPPELEEEVNAASMDERSSEVVRIVKALQRHAATLADSTAAQAGERPIDPYEVLGLEEEASAGDIKKRYWRLSLLIHPDKCEHPQAHDAFQAVSKAAKELQDAGARAAADERRKDARLRAEFEAEAAKEERARQWRIMRGEATAQDLAGPVAAQYGGPAREAWMTELPPERRAGGGLPAAGTVQIGFSKAGVKGRGDTSEWTLTPVQRAAQLEGGPGPGQGPMLITTGSEAGSHARLQQTATAVDQYNAQRRKKTLLEQHMEKQQQPQPEKKKRKKEKQAAAPELDYDPTQHPWRPFDREKDLGPGLKGPANPQELLQNAKALGSRFSGGQGSANRTFL